MTYIENILNNFKTKAMRFIVLLSVLGIIVSAYPTYNKIVNSGFEKRLAMLEKLSNIDNKCKSSSIIELKEQSINEYKKYPQNYEGALTDFFSQSTYYPYYTFFFKFVTGGILFFAVYFIQACAVSIRSQKSALQRISLAEIARINTHSILIWLGLSIGNMIVPMFAPVINYILIPSCITFIYAFIEIIFKEAGDKISPPQNDDFTGLIKIS